jgi:CheY-like chemotaxis protein
MIHELSSAASIAAQEASLVAFWSAYGRAPGRELYADDGLVRITTNVPNPLLNGIFHTRLTPAAAESAISSTQAYYAARGLPMLWWIGPNTQPDDLADRLMSAGFTPADDLPMMAIDLQSMRMEPTPPNVTIKQVEREDELRAWSRILTEAFSLAGTAPHSFEELEHSLGLESEGRRYRFIAYLHDQPVATSALFADVGVAGIYSVATLPEDTSMPRILVVDDAPAVLDLYRDMLTDEGYEVKLETGPTLDLDTVEQAAPDLIILDYLFGYEAAGLVMVQQLTMRPANARLPIIVCTAVVHLIKEVQPDLERQGIVAVSKLFAIDALLRWVAQALASPPGRQVGAPQ